VKPADPRQPVDPRSRQASSASPGESVATVDHAATMHEVKKEHPSSVDLTDAGRGQKRPLPEGAPQGKGVETVSDDEDDTAVGAGNLPLVPTRQIMQGLPSIGFSEAWLRQFLSQTPTAGSQQAPAVGRKVLGASGDQMVYVDEISPSEILLLTQFVFMLEERLRRTGRSVDLAQRVSHTFSYLQVDLACDVMLKSLFEEQPFQCSTTGLRFSSREKLRKHQEGKDRRKKIQQHRKGGAEARGWTESIPDWVGNRDLVVGPALFRLGGIGDDGPKASEMMNALAQGAVSDGEDEDGESCGSRWMAPCDDRRSVCPISGEPFERVWSPALNDWAYSDVVALEMNASKPLRFPPGGPMGPKGLSETAVLFKKSCFFNTPLSRRLEALDDCRGSLRGDTAAFAPIPQATAHSDDSELLALFCAARPPVRAFF
ncbi:unnamed protein product, partial [Polarella glacialis]